MIKFQNLAISVAVLCVAGCASTPESVTTEHKGKVTIIHHRRKTSSGLVDKIEAIDAKGAVTQAEVHVYDVGRYIDGSGNIHEAHSVYRTVQSARPNLALPAKVSGGPRTVYTPPNYVPPPKDQRINDAIAEANAAKGKASSGRQADSGPAQGGQRFAWSTPNRDRREPAVAGSDQRWLQHASAPSDATSNGSPECCSS